LGGVGKTMWRKRQEKAGIQQQRQYPAVSRCFGC